ncbi:NRAMP family divalent metal transporter [Noviherbaspirillum massiliense]|uniref:NRAMP family divalent metal transporter n=1 Tax=Noviherbaspirillum massiliense TaxID=1465823 RepID=UPI0002EA1507|nr:divalent metal cation transporter [Noviherbaspirillum massiliense]
MQQLQSTEEKLDYEQESWLAKLGPGLVTGAADDDPSGIATYSQAGARFGFNILWVMLLTYPLMVSIQIICARIGRVSGHGLASNMRRHYPAWLLYSAVLMLVVANTINIAADLSAMGDALKLLIGGPGHWYAAGFGLLSLLLQIFIPYRRYVRVLKWLTLALLAYVATALFIPIPWGQVLKGFFMPQLSWKPEYITTVVAVLGTTISPYLFFWQASEEVEHLIADPHARPVKKAPEQARPQLSRIQIDTYIGMGFASLVACFIMLTTAVTLHAHGAHSIETSAQAAEALRPIAGNFAFALFSIGIIGTGLLSLPVLAGSAAYAMAGTFKWRNSLELKPGLAKEFYAIIAFATLGGVALGLTTVDPVKALYWSAVINGVISTPIMAITMLMASNAKVMGKFVIPRRLRFLGWLATGLMAMSVLFMFYTFVS